MCVSSVCVFACVCIWLTSDSESMMCFDQHPPTDQGNPRLCCSLSHNTDTLFHLSELPGICHEPMLVQEVDQRLYVQLNTDKERM